MSDLLSRLEKATGAFGAVEAAGIANSLSPWETNTEEWHLLVAALRGSLDAALGLVERVLPGSCVTLHGPFSSINIPSPVPNFCWAEIIHSMPGALSPRGWGATLPLALLTALLKAVEEKKQP